MTDKEKKKKTILFLHLCVYVPVDLLVCVPCDVLT